MKYCILTRQDEKSNILATRLKNDIIHNFDEVNPDYVIAIGGDGTIIKASHQYPNSIIFGIHTGHLGFYANYTIDSVEELISDINNQSFKVEKLNLLSCKIWTKDETINTCALNEVTIVTPPRTLILDVYIDNEYLERFRGTGFCISTPSGSTAYNKSLHGSVVDSKLEILQLTEIAGINSNSYRTLSSPLILAKDRIITLKALDEQPVFITADHLSYNINSFEKMEVEYLGKEVRLAYHKQEGFIKRINRTFLISKE